MKAPPPADQNFGPDRGRIGGTGGTAGGDGLSAASGRASSAGSPRTTSPPPRTERRSCGSPQKVTTPPWLTLASSVVPGRARISRPGDGGGHARGAEPPEHRRRRHDDRRVDRRLGGKSRAGLDRPTLRRWRHRFAEFPLGSARHDAAGNWPAMAMTRRPSRTAMPGPAASATSTRGAGRS